MFVRVNASDSTVHLEDPGVFTQFHVSTSTHTAIEEVLRTLGPRAKACDAEHVFLRIEAVIELAGDQATPSWNESFRKMIDFARSKGWADDTGDYVRAHIERASAR